MASPNAVLRTSIAAGRGGAGDARTGQEGVSAQIFTICGLCLLLVLSAQDQTVSWQSCKGTVLPLPTESGKVKVQSAVFLLFPLVPGS